MKSCEVQIVDGEQVLEFRVHKIPATKMEKWLGRAVFLVGNSLPPVEDKKFFAALMQAVGRVPFERAEPLLDELFSYAERKIEPGVYNPVSLKTMDNYIESPLTITKLRLEVLKHNLSFLPQGYLSKAESTLTSFGEEVKEATESPRMSTSIKMSPQS